MVLPEKWAKPEDFATLFQYLWYRDFPIDQKATGARRADWTIHIGIVIRSIAALMGLIPRFEHGKRTDAVLRSTAGDEIAIEWEWGGVWYNELAKLNSHKVFSTEKEVSRLLKYAVLITYTHTPKIDEVAEYVKNKWKEAQWPLLLILIDLDESNLYSSHKKFNDIQAVLFENGNKAELRKSPAFPWQVRGTQWSTEHVGKWPK
jgi:hypothetical protein